jgi:DnaJ-class molecular chaperone
MSESYYDILEVTKTTSAEEIRIKWKKLSMKYHPDKLPVDKRDWGEAKMKDINEAYKVLNDPRTRQQYDMFGKDFANNGGGGGFNPADLFRQANNNNDGIEPILVVVDMTMEEIFSGIKKTQTIIRNSHCKECLGTCYEDKKKHICANCKGSGQVLKHVQFGPILQTVPQPCPKCNSTGVFSSTIKKCLKCSGKGLVTENHIIEINIEAGASSHNDMQIPNTGNQKIGDNKRGVVIVKINELDHSLFDRGSVCNNSINMTNISMKITLTLCESLIGFSKIFTYLDDTKFVIKSSEVIQNGDIKMIKGKGLPYKNSKYTFGDLIVKFSVKNDKIDPSKIPQLYELLTGEEYKSPIDDHSDVIIPEKMISAENYVMNDDDQDEQPNMQQGCTQQ